MAADDQQQPAPEPPASELLMATFKWEETADDGEDIGPVVVFSPEEHKVIWESPEWMRLSEAQALASQKQWQFTQDGSSTRDEELAAAVRQADAEAAAFITDEGMRRYFHVPTGEDLPDVARKILDAQE